MIGGVIGGTATVVIAVIIVVVIVRLCRQWRRYQKAVQNALGKHRPHLPLSASLSVYYQLHVSTYVIGSS